MVTKLISAIKYSLKTKLSDLSKMKEVGLSYIKIKQLKHDTSNTVKQHKFFGNHFSYVNSYDFLHSLEEIFIEEVYRSKLSESPLIIDCGANIGLSVLYFKRKYPNAEIIAYEPDQNNYELIKSNIEKYALQNVDLRKQAVWIKDEILQFKTVGSLGSMIVKEADSDTYDVQAIRLKDVLCVGKRVDMLKMDIEGAEYDVIKDIADDLKHVDNLFLEYHGSFAEAGKLSELFTILSSVGFSYYIKEALNIYKTPFYRDNKDHPYDVQLNIFCFRAK